MALAQISSTCSTRSSICSSTAHIHSQCFCIQGKKHKMEDFICISERDSFFAVFDGHSGKEAASFACDNLLPMFNKMLIKYNVADCDIKAAIHHTFLKLNKRMHEVYG